MEVEKNAPVTSFTTMVMKVEPFRLIGTAAEIAKTDKSIENFFTGTRTVSSQIQTTSNNSDNSKLLDFISSSEIILQRERLSKYHEVVGNSCILDLREFNNESYSQRQNYDNDSVNVNVKAKLTKLRSSEIKQPMEEPLHFCHKCRNIFGTKRDLQTHVKDPSSQCHGSRSTSNIQITAAHIARPESIRCKIPLHECSTSFSGMRELHTQSRGEGNLGQAAPIPIPGLKLNSETANSANLKNDNHRGGGIAIKRKRQPRTISKPLDRSYLKNKSEKPNQSRHSSIVEIQEFISCKCCSIKFSSELGLNIHECPGDITGAPETPEPGENQDHIKKEVEGTGFKMRSQNIPLHHNSKTEEMPVEEYINVFESHYPDNSAAVKTPDTCKAEPAASEEPVLGRQEKLYKLPDSNFKL